MGTSVINPMIFYWMNVLGNLDCGLNIVGIGLTFVLAVRVFIYVMGMDELYYYAKFKDSSYHVREAEQSLENGTKCKMVKSKHHYHCSMFGNHNLHSIQRYNAHNVGS